MNYGIDMVFGYVVFAPGPLDFLYSVLITAVFSYFSSH